MFESQAGGRLTAPAAGRNRAPILAVLTDLLPAEGLVLEVACGTGEHACHFAAATPGLSWQPTDPEPAHRKSADAWARHLGLTNVLPALDLDVCAAVWPVERADAIFCANMIHIAPWEATLGLVSGAARVLAPGHSLILYGPFMFDGQHTAQSNERFDHSLRSRDPAWGVRDLRRVEDAAAVHGLTLVDQIAMPANNQIVVFQRT